MSFQSTLGEEGVAVVAGVTPPIDVTLLEGRPRPATPGDADEEKEGWSYFLLLVPNNNIN